MSTQEFLKSQLAPVRNNDKAHIRDSKANPSNLITVYEEIPLDTASTDASPYRIGGPWKCVYVADATDPNVEVKIKPVSKNIGQGAVPLSLKDVLKFDFPIDGAYLTWEAQAGKTITLVFLLESSFISGSNVSATSGGVSITEGSSVSAMTQVTLAAATAAIIIPQDFARKITVLQNKTGAALYVAGTSAVTNSGATEGIMLLANEILEWKNTGALYGYSVAGGTVSYFTEA